MFMGDVFESALFKQTFQRVFSKDSKDEFKTAYNASFEVKVTPIFFFLHTTLKLPKK